MRCKDNSNSVPIPFTWHDYLVTGYTLGGKFITVAVVAEQGVILAGKRLICQRAVAAETAEAVLVVMPVLVEELLAAQQEEEILVKVVLYSWKPSMKKKVTFPPTLF